MTWKSIKNFRRNIKSKITLIMISGLLVSIVTVGIFSFIFVTSVLQRSLQEKQLEVARRTMEEIDEVLYKRLLDIQIISETLKDKEKERYSQALREFTVLTGPWDILRIVNSEGVIISSSDKKEIKRKISGTPLFSIWEEAQKGVVVHSDVVLGVTNIPTVLFATPLQSGGDVTNIIIGNFSWRAIEQVIEEVNEHAVLVNGNGVIVAHNKAYNSPVDLFLKNFSHKDFIQKIFSGTEQSIILGKGEGFLSGRALVSLVPQQGYLGYGGSGWGLIVETPTAVTFKSATKEALKLVAIITVLFSLLIMTMLFFITRFVVRPIQSLTDTAEMIAQGNFSERVKINLKDEIGRLAGSFNNMADKIVIVLNKIKKAKAKDEAILESMGDGMVVTDKERLITVVNSATARMLKRTPESLVGERWPEVLGDLKDSLGEKVPITDLPIFLALREKKRIVSKKFYYVQDNKKIFPVDITVAPVMLDNKIIGVVEIFRDITDEVTLSRLKDEFIYVTSHQLKTPLSSVKLFTDVLSKNEEKTLSVKQKEYIGFIVGSINQMLALVNSFLDLAKIELGKFKLTEAKVNIEEIIEKVIKTLNVLSKNNNCTIFFSKPEETLPEIVTDQGLVEQVVNNFIENSIFYSGSKKCDIRIRLRQKGEFYEISVEDQGIGIPKNEQKNIFQKFFRAENARDLKKGGTGMGMYITKMVAELLEGEVWFESEEGVGSTFHFTLPVHRSNKD